MTYHIWCDSLNVTEEEPLNLCLTNLKPLLLFHLVQFVCWRIFLKLYFKGRAFVINTLLSYRGQFFVVYVKNKVILCWLAWLAWLACWLAWVAGSLARILYTLLPGSLWTGLWSNGELGRGKTPPFSPSFPSLSLLFFPQTESLFTGYLPGSD